MKKKVKEWLQARGRRLVELKLLGGGELFKNRINSGMSKLTTEELIEFLQLSGQLQAIIWVLSPHDEEKMDKMANEISKYLSNIEKDIIKVKKIAGMRRIPKGKA